MKTTCIRNAVGLALVALSASPAIAGGLIAYEVGTEDVGLAAAGYAARAQDASTVFTNPAGMTRLEGTQITLGGQALYSGMKFSNTSGTSSQLGTQSGGNIIGDSGWFPGGGFYMSYAVNPNLRLGFANTGSFGSSLKYDDNWVGRYYVQQATMIGASLLPSIAYKVNEQWSVGLSVNAMYGYMKNVVAINNVPENRGDGKLVMRDTKWGWGGNLGVMYEASRDTRFGLTYSSQVKLNFAPSAQFTNTGPILSGVLAARGLQGTTVDLGVTVPQQLMASMFHKIDDRWSVLGNIGWQQWSKFGEVEVSVPDTQNPRSLTTQLNFKDTWHAALGAQYRLSEPWRLNFGVSYDSAFQSGNVSAFLPTNQSWRFGVGGQQQVDKSFSWGFAGEYVYGGTTNVNSQATVPVALGGRGNLVGSYDSIGIWYMSANANWKF